MARVTGTPKTDKFTVSANNVIIVTAKKSRTEGISKSGNNKIYGAAAKDAFTVKGGKYNYIYGDKGNDTITVTGKIGTGNKIYGDDAKGKESGNDTFNINSGKKNYFYGGKGADTFKINGGTANYLYGGAGKDTYIFGKKKATATIKDYAAGQDTLKVNSGTITSTTLKNKNVIFKAGNASITVAGAVKKTISLKDSRGSYNMSKTAITLGSNFTGTMDAAKYLSTVKTIDGRNATKTVNITGNGQNNTIYAGKAGGTLNGGAGNNTLHGGADDDIIIITGSGKNTAYGDAGNDTINIAGGVNGVIYGGTGTDTFHHTSGTATIKDYEAGETLSFANAITDVTFDGQDMTLTAGTGGSVTVEDAAGKLTQITESGKKKNLLYALENDTFHGTDDGDIIFGNGGGAVYGGKGDDLLYGGPHRSLYGEDGNDVLYGGCQQSGETGADLLYSGSDTTFMNGGVDTDEDRFFFSSDSYKGTIEIYNFKAENDLIAFRNEGENTITVSTDPYWKGSPGNAVYIGLSNGSFLYMKDYHGGEGDSIRFYDERSNTISSITIVSNI